MTSKRITAEELIDRAEITDVLIGVFSAIDEKRAEDLADLFTEDGVFCIGDEVIPIRPYISVNKRLAEQLLQSRHYLSNLRFSINGDMASVSSYVIAYGLVPAAGTVSPLQGPKSEDYATKIGGEQQDEFVRVDGRWRIKRRRVLYHWRSEEEPCFNDPVFEVGASE